MIDQVHVGLVNAVGLTRSPDEITGASLQTSTSFYLPKRTFDMAGSIPIGNNSTRTRSRSVIKTHENWAGFPSWRDLISLY